MEQTPMIEYITKDGQKRKIPLLLFRILLEELVKIGCNDSILVVYIENNEERKEYYRPEELLELLKRNWVNCKEEIPKILSLQIAPLPSSFFVLVLTFFLFLI